MLCDRTQSLTSQLNRNALSLRRFSRWHCTGRQAALEEGCVKGLEAADPRHGPLDPEVVAPSSSPPSMRCCVSGFVPMCDAITLATQPAVMSRRATSALMIRLGSFLPQRPVTESSSCRVSYDLRKVSRPVSTARPRSSDRLVLIWDVQIQDGGAQALA